MRVHILGSLLAGFSLLLSSGAHAAPLPITNTGMEAHIQNAANLRGQLTKVGAPKSVVHRPGRLLWLALQAEGKISKLPAEEQHVTLQQNDGVHAPGVLAAKLTMRGGSAGEKLEIASSTQGFSVSQRGAPKQPGLNPDRGESIHFSRGEIFSGSAKKQRSLLRLPSTARRVDGTPIPEGSWLVSSARRYGRPYLGAVTYLVSPGGGKPIRLGDREAEILERNTRHD